MNLQNILNDYQNPTGFQIAVKNQLTLSKEVANEHLLDAPVASTRSHRHPSCLGHSFTPIFIGGGRTVNHYHNGRPARRNEKEMSDGTRAAVGIIGSLIMLVGSYFIGKSIEARNDASEKLDETKAFRKEFKIQQNYHNSDSIDTITKATKRVLKRSIASANWAIALKVALVAGAAIAVIGAITANPVVAAVGGGVVLLAGCALLVKWGIESANRANKRDARIIMNPSRDQRANLKRNEQDRVEAWNRPPATPAPEPSAPPAPGVYPNPPEEQTAY